MTFARILLNASSDHRNENPSGWDYQMRGATQGHEYYEQPYRHTIAEYIAMAVDVIAALREEGIIA